MAVLKQQFSVYTRSAAGFAYEATIFAVDLETAVADWDDMFGGNYGPVLIMNPLCTDKHVGLEIKATR